MWRMIDYAYLNVSVNLFLSCLFYLKTHFGAKVALCEVWDVLSITLAQLM